MRTLEEVVNRIIREIPTSWPRRSQFSASLRSLATLSKYGSPEKQQKYWDQIAHTLELFIGDPDEEWKRRIAGIFSQKDSI